MRILFVHQNFPGQYKHLIRELSRNKSHQIVGLGINALSENIPRNIVYIRYSPKRGNTSGIHPFVLETETKCIRGEACANAAYQLKKDGFIPDLICAHSGWGESLFLKDIWPDCPILTYQELYYQQNGFDYAFDPEFQTEMTWQDTATLRMKNTFIQQTLECSDWNITPTAFQKNSFPQRWQQKISVIHDGIDTSKIVPMIKNVKVKINKFLTLDSNCEVITYVNRAIEPYRGCHTLIRAIPKLQELAPNAYLIIIGNPNGDGYGPGPKNSITWKDHFLNEIQGNYDPKRVIFTGSLSYDNYLKMLQISSVHIYLTYPFVLSWSMLEAMSTGCPIIGSSTQSVTEVIKNEENGLLTDFFDSSELATKIDFILKNKVFAKCLGAAARETIEKQYSVDYCMPKQLALMHLIAKKIF